MTHPYPKKFPCIITWKFESGSVTSALIFKGRNHWALTGIVIASNHTFNDWVTHEDSELSYEVNEEFAVQKALEFTGP